MPTIKLESPEGDIRVVFTYEGSPRDGGTGLKISGSRATEYSRELRGRPVYLREGGDDDTTNYFYVRRVMSQMLKLRDDELIEDPKVEWDYGEFNPDVIY